MRVYDWKRGGFHSCRGAVRQTCGCSYCLTTSRLATVHPIDTEIGKSASWLVDAHATAAYRANCLVNSGKSLIVDIHNPRQLGDHAVHQVQIYHPLSLPRLDKSSTPSCARFSILLSRVRRRLPDIASANPTPYDIPLLCGRSERLICEGGRSASCGVSLWAASLLAASVDSSSTSFCKPGLCSAVADGGDMVVAGPVMSGVDWTILRAPILPSCSVQSPALPT